MPETLSMSTEAIETLHRAEWDFVDLDARLRGLSGRLASLSSPEAKEALDGLAAAKDAVWRSYLSLRDSMAEATAVYEAEHPLPF